MPLPENWQQSIVREITSNSIRVWQHSRCSKCPGIQPRGGQTYIGCAGWFSLCWILSTSSHWLHSILPTFLYPYRLTLKNCITWAHITSGCWSGFYRRHFRILVRKRGRDREGSGHFFSVPSFLWQYNLGWGYISFCCDFSPGLTLSTGSQWHHISSGLITPRGGKSFQPSLVSDVSTPGWFPLPAHISQGCPHETYSVNHLSRNPDRPWLIHTETKIYFSPVLSVHHGLAVSCVQGLRLMDTLTPVPFLLTVYWPLKVTFLALPDCGWLENVDDYMGIWWTINVPLPQGQNKVWPFSLCRGGVGGMEQ